MRFDRLVRWLFVMEFQSVMAYHARACKACRKTSENRQVLYVFWKIFKLVSSSVAFLSAMAPGPPRKKLFRGHWLRGTLSETMQFQWRCPTGSLMRSIRPTSSTNKNGSSEWYLTDWFQLFTELSLKVVRSSVLRTLGLGPSPQKTVSRSLHSCHSWQVSGERVISELYAI